jgi:cell fate regulator YaaT (PSP1 superfamily)
VEEKENLNIPQENNECENCSNLRIDGGHRHCSKPCNSGCFKLESFDYLKEISDLTNFDEIMEIRFKNTRKGYFQNSNKLRLEKGDVVAVEASPGHDIGIVALTGQTVWYKMLSEGFNYKNPEIKKIYRKAKPVDIDKWKEAIGLEHKTMIKSRKIATDLGLNMKIGDVEYQGDRTKAIFYYIADDRVDFRQLIKVLAEEFKIRVEMRQIGARQEAGRIGGIGSCGRELCCASWIKNFVSVTTNAARYQEVSLNPQKLAGQCGKLKCCMNYELDAYLDAQEDFPDTSIILKTKNGTAVHMKTDVFKRLMWYSYQEGDKKSITCMTIDTINEIIEMNAKGNFPEKLTGVEESSMVSVIEYQNAVGVESLTRFEDKPDPSAHDMRKKGGKPFKKLHHNRRFQNDRKNPRNDNKN